MIDSSRLARDLALLFVCGSALLCAVAARASSTVFRCVQAGVVLYSDERCPGAERLEINAGKAAPDAAERLRRDQAALDLGARERRAAQAREEALRIAQANESAQREAMVAALAAGQAGSDEYYYPAYGYNGYYPGYGYDGYGLRRGGRAGHGGQSFDGRRSFHGHRFHQRVISVPPPVSPTLRRH